MSTRGRGGPGRLAALIAVAIGAAFALAAPVARADLIDLTACNTSTLTQPFAPWADLASYELAPRGDFENATWTLSGSARRDRGSEPYAATGALGSWSVALPAGSSVRSPSSSPERDRCLSPSWTGSGTSRPGSLWPDSAGSRHP